MDVFWRNPLLRFKILRAFAKVVFPEYRFKWPQMAWWTDTSFTAYLKKFGEHNGMNTDRRWMLYQLQRLVENVAGDTAECGVYTGAASFLICTINASTRTFSRHHFAFDSFEGLSVPADIDGAHWTRGDLTCNEEAVARNLQKFQRLTLLKGWIPARFPEVADRRFAFVHIDVDLYQPTRDSIEFFYPRLNDGGVLICDDYGFTSCPGATLACDEFLEGKAEKMLALSGGGGFLIKGCTTAVVPSLG